MSFDTTPWNPSEWWIVVFTDVELAVGAARYTFPLDKATGGALVHSKSIPFEYIRTKWEIDAEHMHAYQLANREADKVASVEQLLSAEEAVRLWNRFATDSKEKTQ